MKMYGLAAVCISVAFTAISQAAITMQSSDVAAYALSGGSGVSSQSFTGSTIPTHTSVNASIGSVYSNNAIDWYANGPETTLSATMDQKRSGRLNAGSQAGEYVLNFTADADGPFQLSGYYNATDVGADTGEVGLFAQFVDMTAGVTLFANSQISRNTHNEQFVLGDVGGDDPNSYVTGNPIGNVIAGHSYQLRHYNFIEAFPDADSGATAVGVVTLTIGTAVPEPSTMLLAIATFAALPTRPRKSVPHNRV